MRIPFIPGCNVQTYGNVPAFLGRNCQRRSGAMSVERKPPAMEETLWGNGSLLIHVTVSPTFTIICVGENVVPSIVTMFARRATLCGRCPASTCCGDGYAASRTVAIVYGP